MRKLFVRTVWIAVGLLFVSLMTGCTLSGAEPAPLTPVGDTGLPTNPTEQPTQEVIIIPTTAPTVDVFGTATAASSGVGGGDVTPGTTEPGGEVMPTGEATAQATIAVPPTTLLISPTPGGQTSGGTGQCPATHTVAAGENLFRIALKYGIDWHELAAANGITNERSLQVGQVLTIPGCQGGSTQPTSVAPTTAPSGAQTYTVAPGDNLFRIALKFGITWQELAAFNNITDPATLQVGQVLQIPAH